MSDLLTDLLENAPKGVTVKDLGTNDRGDRVIQWWACSRFGISLRLPGSGARWAEALEVFQDGSSVGWDTRAATRDLEGFGAVIEYLREVIAEYRPAIQF
jgi:hypothetical protein